MLGTGRGFAPGARPSTASSRRTRGGGEGRASNGKAPGGERGKGGGRRGHDHPVDRFSLSQRLLGNSPHEAEAHLVEEADGVTDWRVTVAKCR